MKIDLHTHTPTSEVNGDSIKWESTQDAIKKMFLNGIRAFAFTDHNSFSMSRYLEAKKIIKNNMIVFPGVEVNVIKNNEKLAHVLVIFPDDLNDMQLKEIEDICKKELRKKGIRVAKLNTMFNNFSTIKIPHVGKSENFTWGELDDLEHDAIETTSLDNKDYISWTKNRNDKSVVSFSDTHIWTDYPQNNSIVTAIDFDGTFTDLKAKLALNKNYTERNY